jgi:hypothetical protein
MPPWPDIVFERSERGYVGGGLEAGTGASGLAPEIMKIAAFLPGTIEKGKNLDIKDVIGQERSDAPPNTSDTDGKETPGNEPDTTDPVKGKTDAAVKRIADLHKSSPQIEQLTCFKQGVAARSSYANDSADNPSDVAVVAINEDAKIGVATIKIYKKGRPMKCAPGIGPVR